MGKRVSLSIVIPVKDLSDKRYHDLMHAFLKQDFPKDLYEIIPITEGTSESAKAIGIHKSQGKVIGIMASDNMLVDKNFLTKMYNAASVYGAATTLRYAHEPEGLPMDRYFALFGGNDPLCWFLGKCDRASYLDPDFRELSYFKSFPAFGDNGFFIRKELLLQSDMEHYYHIDNIYDLYKKGILTYVKFVKTTIAHHTGEEFFAYLKKRNGHVSRMAFNQDRRWHMVEKGELWKVMLFAVYTMTFILPLIDSARLYSRKKDTASFMHLPLCMGILYTYAILTLKRIFQGKSLWSSVQRAGEKA